MPILPEASRECTCPPLPGGRKRDTALRTWRPGFRRLVTMIVAGEVDGVIAYDLDRTARDPRDLEDLIDAVESRRPRVPVQSVTGSLRLANDADIAMARVMVAMANKSSRDTARRVSRKRQEQAANGAFGGGHRPYGYAADGMTVIDAEAAEIRRWAGMILSGVSLRHVAEDARERGVKTVRGAQWQASVIRDILTSRRVAGLAQHQGEVTGDAQWPAILPREQSEALWLLLLNPARRTTTGNTPRHLLSLIARCGACEAGRHRGHRDRAGPEGQQPVHLPRARHRARAPQGRAG
jgi:site-specific DNA recombinase